jgi:hypothetical protein
MKKPPKKRPIKFVRLGAKPPSGVKGGTPFGDFNPNNGIIRIDPRQSEDEMIDTIVHELIHATYPFLEEETVQKGATQVAKSLWDLGYRRTHK